MSRTLKLTLAYDGAGFVGWQRQASGTSIQGLVEDALARIEGSAVTVIGAGRTDAGAHALGQVASVHVTSAIETDALRRALNAILPPAIRVLQVEEAPSDFHARFAARSKTYWYRLACGDLITPFERGYLWHIPQPLDVDAMSRAARLIEGSHDFAAFQAAGSSVVVTARTVFTSELHEDEGCRILNGSSAGLRRLTYGISGDGFLRHMVRTIVGTIVEIGLGRREVESMARTLAARDRGEAGPTAPALGLFLVRVDY